MTRLRGTRLRRAVWIATLGAAATWAVLVFGWIPFWMGGMAVHRRFRFRDAENGGLTPASFQLKFESISIRTEDRLHLSGWWVPATAPKGTVVLVHGLNRSRVEMVRKAPFLVGEGWNVLLFDLRHHGTSEGETSGLGVLETRDVRAAAAFAKLRSPRPVVVWGVSLGGAASTLAAADDPSITGLVCDSSYLSLRDTVGHHIRLFRSFRWWLRVVPPWPIADALLFWAGVRGGFDPGAADVEAAARRLKGRPALFVANLGDRRMPPAIAVALKEAAGPSAEVLLVPGDSHGGAYRDATAAYEAAVRKVLLRASEVAE
jgi:pimeloyl-ACP methyl ester carboxylesterase